LACNTCLICVVDIYHHISMMDWCLFCIILACNTCSISAVDIYHHISMLDWCVFWPATPVQYVRWISTTIFLWWTGVYSGLQHLSNMCGGYLPPYFYDELVFILYSSGLQHLSNMCGGYLPPYFYDGLVFILYYSGLQHLSNMCGRYLPPYLWTGVYVVLFWPATPVQYVRWISTTTFL
jgi:hypothetical protein